MKWMMALTTVVFTVPLSTCATTAVNGLIQSVTPCDYLNCDDPTYFDVCMWIECERTSTTTTTDDTDTTTTTDTTPTTTNE
jgi:hypothetical protein